MQKCLLFLVLVFVFTACKKSSTTPDGTKQVNGVLHYDNVLGGLGMYYVAEGNNTMLFRNEFGNDPHDSLEYNKYYITVGLNSTLKYLDTGETGCFEGNPSLCGFPVVQIVDISVR
jgi:hypothetical protein